MIEFLKYYTILYLISALIVALYHITIQLTTQHYARKYGVEIDNFEIDTKGVCYLFIPFLNTAAAVALWLLYPQERAKIQWIIIMSTHPDICNDEDEIDSG